MTLQEAVQRQLYIAEMYCARCCTTTKATPLRLACANGVSLAYWLCLPGGHRLRKNGQNIPYRELRALGLFADELPTLDGRLLPEGGIECEVRGCRNLGAEVHHWAPAAIFGEAAGAWPQSLLCRAHHREWHDRMKAAKHNPMAYASGHPCAPERECAAPFERLTDL